VSRARIAGSRHHPGSQTHSAQYGWIGDGTQQMTRTPHSQQSNSVLLGLLMTMTSHDRARMRAVIERLYGHERVDEACRMLLEVAWTLDFTNRLAAKIARDRKKAPGGARSKVSARRGGARVRRVQL